jgi:hypothetical protein
MSPESATVAGRLTCPARKYATVPECSRMSPDNAPACRDENLVRNSESVRGYCQGPNGCTRNRWIASVSVRSTLAILGGKDLADGGYGRSIGVSAGLSPLDRVNGLEAGARSGRYSLPERASKSSDRNRSRSRDSAARHVGVNPSRPDAERQQDEDGEHERDQGPATSPPAVGGHRNPAGRAGQHLWAEAAVVPPPFAEEIVPVHRSPPSRRPWPQRSSRAGACGSTAHRPHRRRHARVPKSAPMSPDQSGSAQPAGA